MLTPLGRPILRAAAILGLFAAASCAEAPLTDATPSALSGGPPSHAPDPWGGKASVYARIDAIVVSGHGVLRDVIELRMTILDDAGVATCTRIITRLDEQPTSVRSAMVALATSAFDNRFSIGISPAERPARRTSSLVSIGQMTAGEPLSSTPGPVCRSV